MTSFEEAVLLALTDYEQKLRRTHSLFERYVSDISAEQALLCINLAMKLTSEDPSSARQCSSVDTLYLWLWRMSNEDSGSRPHTRARFEKWND